MIQLELTQRKLERSSVTVAANRGAKCVSEFGTFESKQLCLERAHYESVYIEQKPDGYLLSVQVMKGNFQNKFFILIFDQGLKNMFLKPKC